MKLFFRAVWLLLPVAWAAATPVPASQPNTVGQPNIVVILTDDQGYGELSCHGNPALQTPHLDRLHAESIRLADFHVAPMCTPTRGQLLSGVDALRNQACNVFKHVNFTQDHRALQIMANYKKMGREFQISSIN